MQKLMYFACGAALISAGALNAAQAAAAGGAAEKGKALFQERCALCHNADSDEKKMGPGLKGLFQKDAMANGKKPTEANVHDKIDNGGNGMPPYKDMLSDDEKNSLVAYLKTL